VRADDGDGLLALAVTLDADLVVIGPEGPLVAGVADELRRNGIAVFGPGAEAARIEGSKTFAKDVMRAAGVPTAETLAVARPPCVVKADGLAAGKGVFVCRTAEELDEALRAVQQYEGGIVIEELLDGREVSLFAISDGRRAVPLGAAQDFKRIGDGDTGPNTGGMGAFAPTRLAEPARADDLCQMVVAPIVEALRERNIVYRGALYAGLMLTADGLKVVEYNCRLGDPETQVVLPLLGDDFAELAYATATGELPGQLAPVNPGYYCGVVLAAGGYPGSYDTGVPIDGLDRVDPAALVFHAGTRRADNGVVTAGGRVLTVVGQGATLAAARQHAYANVERIHFAGAQYRHDIAVREIDRGDYNRD
jgi:phosphoribosylamine--glycine ligase